MQSFGFKHSAVKTSFDVKAMFLKPTLNPMIPGVFL
jgi:hypothetical protein